MITGNPIAHLVSVQMQGKGSEARVVTVLGTRVLFSYETPVAFTTRTGASVILEGKHSKTTRKHINNWIDDGPDAKNLYVDSDQFPGLLRSELTKALRETPPRATEPPPE